MTEYVLVERDRWERVRSSALHNGTSRHIYDGDLDPVQPVTLSDADREALARDLGEAMMVLFTAGDSWDELDPVRQGNWIDDARTVLRLLARWHIVRRTPEPGA